MHHVTKHDPRAESKVNKTVTIPTMKHGAEGWGVTNSEYIYIRRGRRSWESPEVGLDLTGQGNKVDPYLWTMFGTSSRRLWESPPTHTERYERRPCLWRIRCRCRSSIFFTLRQKRIRGGSTFTECNSGPLKQCQLLL